MLELNKGNRAPVETEMIEFIALPFPSSKKKKNLIISRRSCVGTAKKWTKKRDASAELFFLLTKPIALLVDATVAVAVVAS